MRTKTRIELEFPVLIEGVEFDRISVAEILRRQP
jgi:hypothetical protein